jgi:ureidoacrylate peracid hydrolase
MSDDFSERRMHQQLDFDPQHAAVLVVDMLNEFLEEGGLMVLAPGRALYGPIGRLVDAAHGAGLPVIWLCDEHQAMDKEFEKRIVHCLRGSWGAQIVDALQPGPRDYRIPKRRYSGFFQTDLDLRLRELRIDHVIVTGIVTNICVRSTVHDAFFLGYNVIVPADCVAATSAREQESSLYDIETHYGTVMSLEQVLPLLGATPTTAAGHRAG